MSKKESTTKKKIQVNTTAGSLAYNRLDMQISQTLHMAIELFDDLNYLLVLDYYDDITLFDLDKDPMVVSYYQMKTNEQVIQIDTAIKEDWILKLNKQLERPDWIVKELGLITNCPLDISYKYKDEDGKNHKKTEILNADSTPFNKFNSITVDKIKNDIAKKIGSSIDAVDLSKFAHLRTTLTIGNHRDIVEKELGDFLYDKYPKIKMDTVKAVYSAMMDLLAKKQGYERLPENTDFEDVKRYKGIVRDDFNRVIDKAIMVSIPEIQELMEFLGQTNINMQTISLPYVTIMSDSGNRGNALFPKLFERTLQQVHESEILAMETAWDYCRRIEQEIREEEKRLCLSFVENYIAVLAACIMINESRKSV